MKTNNTTLRYKGFYGIFGYSQDDGCYFGRIMGITDLVTFKGRSMSALETAFFDAVDDYLFLRNDKVANPDAFSR